MNGADVWVDLEPKHVAYADKVAADRQAGAIARRRRVVNNQNPADAPKAHILGARCEAAAFLFLRPVVWNRPIETITGIADLDDFIDVKGSNRWDGPLIVQRNGRDDWAYLLIHGADHPHYHIAGWAWGAEVKRPHYWADPVGGRPAYFVRPSDPIIKPPAELLAILRRRQAANPQPTTERRRA